MPYKAAAGRVSPKGVALNLTTTIMFITPILLTTVGLHLWTHLWKANVVALFLTLITPPWGWKKPHPRGARVPAESNPRLRPRPRRPPTPRARRARRARSVPHTIARRRYSDQPHLRSPPADSYKAR